MTETNLTGQTQDILAQNIAELKRIFPEVVTESKIDFEKLQEILGNYIETENERYNFSWNGKSKALRLAQSPSTGTLLPNIKESKNFDTTQNMYIEGDNLEVLKLLQKSYHSKIKMIYIVIHSVNLRLILSILSILISYITRSINRIKITNELSLNISVVSGV